MSVLEDARAIIAAGGVCDACLGRVFADRSHGLTNRERGRSLRITIGLEDDEEPGFVDPDECWVCEGYCGAFEAWAERAAAAVEGTEFETYQVGTRPPALIEENERMLREEAGLPADAGEKFNSEFNREVGKRVGAITGGEVDFGRPDVQFLLDLAEDEVEADINSAFVYGRYRKLERGIPQTKWPCSACKGSGRQGREPCPECDGLGYRYPESVEQLTAPVVEDVMDGVDSVFHGAGREDVDARMLGTGRPFVIEVEEPRRRNVDTDRLEGDINSFAEGKVEVEGLRLAEHGMVERVKRHDASKTYNAQVTFADDITVEELHDALGELDGATIKQETPQRVDHRRASKTRTREVYEVDGELEHSRAASIDVHGAGGLYIKELISSDEGRTKPSLAGLLGVDAEVSALDVIRVDGEDGPFEDEEFLRE
ncbi:MAG: tRNA pseudouridine(54/55) synthase Pus10 [Halolamina sp.]|uniref:tRNA pseudouridine(54/55) synthase Pus10 n=1 Tax=Halolamina sp. TaxID=1940283 RepID=UPI002FC35F11